MMIKFWEQDGCRAYISHHDGAPGVSFEVPHIPLDPHGRDVQAEKVMVNIPLDVWVSITHAMVRSPATNDHLALALAKAFVPPTYCLAEVEVEGRV